jgi:hypothetical protein
MKILMTLSVEIELEGWSEVGDPEEASLAVRDRVTAFLYPAGLTVCGAEVTRLETNERARTPEASCTSAGAAYAALGDCPAPTRTPPGCR